MAIRVLLPLMLASLLIGGCATARLSDAQKLSLYSSHAGAPVKNFRYASPLGWEKVDGDHLLLTVRPREAYLIRTSGPCLEWSTGAPSISITNHVGWVSVITDDVIVPSLGLSCRIEEIRPVDIVAARADRDAMYGAHQE